MKKIILLLIFLPALGLSQPNNQAKIDSLNRVISASKPDTNQAILLGKLAFEYLQIDIEQAIKYEEQSLNLFKQLKWTRGIADSYTALGNFYIEKFDTKHAIENYTNAIKLWQQLGNKTAMAKAYTNIGIAYQNENNLPNSLEYYFKGLQLAEEIKDSNLVAFEQSNIGSLYQIIGDYKKAIQYDSLSMIYFKKTGNQEEVAGNLVGIGNAYKSLGNLDQALNAMLEGLKIYTEINYPFGKALSLSNIATVYDAQNNYLKALKFQYQAMNEFTVLQDENGLSIAQLQLGDYYNKIAMNPEKIIQDELVPASQKACLLLSLNYLQKAIPVLGKRNSLSDLSVAYKIMADDQRALKNYEAAIESYLKYSFYKDSVFSIETAQKIANHETQHEIDLRESKIKLLAKDNKLKDIKAQNQRTTRNALIGGILSLLMISIVLIFYYKRKQQSEKQLADEINTLLKDQELQSVSNMLEGQEQERTRIAADLHDRLGSMLSTVKLYFNSVEEQIDQMKAHNKEQYNKATSLLDEACDEVRKISHNLVSGELIKFGLVSALNQLKETINSTGKLNMQVLSFGMDERLDRSIEISLYRVVQELMNNILKHSKASEVTIQLNKVENNLNIVVEDNGIGFDHDAALQKNGMGLRNMETRIKQLKGSVVFDTGKGRGTTTIIDIPVE